MDKIIRIHLKPALHAALKVKAAREGTTMQKLIEVAIRQAVAR